MPYPVDLTIELEAISHFLEQNLKDIDAEISHIDSEWDESEAQTEDDYGNMMYPPMMRTQITLRATYYELNALIEHHLQLFARKPYSLSPKHASKPKSILDVPQAEISRLRFVTDLDIREIRSLIEGYYRFSFDSISQYPTIQQIREIANSFKHRAGLQDFRRDPKATFPEVHQLTSQGARTAIHNTRDFLLAVFHQISGAELQRSDFDQNGNGA